MDKFNSTMLIIRFNKGKFAICVCEVGVDVYVFVNLSCATSVVRLITRCV